MTLTGSSLTYSDLISAEDREFWQYLCKKDFRRLEKLMTQNIGEGHFIDDSCEDDSDSDDPNQGNPKKLEGGDSGDDDASGNKYNDLIGEAGDDEDGGLNGFLAARDRLARSRGDDDFSKRRGNVRRRGNRDGNDDGGEEGLEDMIDSSWGRDGEGSDVMSL